MLQGILMLLMFAIAYGILYLIYGKDGMELRKKEGKRNEVWVALVGSILVFWLLSVMLSFMGDTDEDIVIGVALVLVVPIIVLVMAIITRKRVKNAKKTWDEIEERIPEKSLI